MDDTGEEEVWPPQREMGDTEGQVRLLERWRERNMGVEYRHTLFLWCGVQDLYIWMIPASLDSDVLIFSTLMACVDVKVTRLLLEVVDVANKNGLKLPREFGLLLKQSLYFNRYMSAHSTTMIC